MSTAHDPNLPFKTPSSVSADQAMEFWEGLTDCLHGDNGYGEDVGEFYIFRMLPFQASMYRDAHFQTDSCSPICGQCTARELYQKANRAMLDLCRQFESDHGVVIEFEGGESIDMLNDEMPFSHRVHLRVRRP